MAFNGKIVLISDGSQLFHRQTQVDINDFMTLRTGQMMMVSPITDAVMMRAIRELNALQQPYLRQFLHRAKHCRATNVCVVLAQRLPQIIRREINATSSELNEVLSDEATLAGVALAQFVKC